MALQHHSGSSENIPESPSLPPPIGTSTAPFGGRSPPSSPLDTTGYVPASPPYPGFDPDANPTDTARWLKRLLDMRNASSPQPSRISSTLLSPAMDRVLSAAVQDPKCSYLVDTYTNKVTDSHGMDTVDRQEDSQVGNNMEWADCDE